jgi:CDP-diglyceride synthetase
MKWQDVLPVLLSILIIIAVAILEKQSKLAAALTATMPLTAPLALWIVYTSSEGDREATSQFSLGMLLGVFPTIGFLITVWLASRAGFRLVPTILLGYGVWAIGALAIVTLRRFLGL